MSLDKVISNYINEQIKGLKKGTNIRLKEKIKTDDKDFWEPYTVVEIEKIQGNKITLKSLDGDSATVDINKLKYEKV